MKIKYLFICCLCFATLSLRGQDASHANITNCKLCHSCENPTLKNPCLKNCPRLDMLGSHHSADDAPDVIYMDGLSDIYVPVVFSHKLHAQMADMSGGCQLCHHHSPTEDISLCIECHPASPKRADLSRPSLKGAYHRQCLGCHREWSHDTKCAVCHALKNSLRITHDYSDSTDFIGSKHPPIPEPEKIIYETTSEEGNLVTFYHNEHVHLFNLKCVDCHQKENCQKCHDLAKPTLANLTQSGDPVKIHKTEADHHKACFNCHSGQKCTSCHSRDVKDPFNHYTRAGWRLNAYHKNLNCRKCHKMSNCFTGLKKGCANCHQDWTTENFNHVITGLKLDENHLEIECDICHTNYNFSRKPACSECHDEDFSFPDNKPGKLIKQGR